MVKIIIASPSYNESIGGAVVLHKLCHILNTIGYDAYLSTTPKLNGPSLNFILNSDWNVKIADSIDIDNAIVIYPEIQPGNPYQAKHVVRYILNKFHLPEYDNTIITWSDKDYWLYFHDLFYDRIKEPNYLHIIDSKVDKFIDFNKERTIDACFTYRKRSHEIENLNLIHPKNSIEIGYNTSDEYLIDIFNKCKRFYSYDTETYLSVLASLCGCESIIVPYKNLTKANIINSQPSFKYGVAYGLEEIEYSNNTRQDLRNYLKDLEEKQINEVKITFDKILTFFNL
jgi:hypothetical protein